MMTCCNTDGLKLMGGRDEYTFSVVYQSFVIGVGPEMFLEKGINLKVVGHVLVLQNECTLYQEVYGMATTSESFSFFLDHWPLRSRSANQEVSLKREPQSVFKSPSKLGAHLSTHCNGDERLSRSCPTRE
ncbi:hypothetical protein TNCV_2895891 [Trichonephila clavipes]|nr:hypothetical protein TNCV_2895891 [Trichonephila clavipes]